MNGCYYANQTLHNTLSDFLEAHGLNSCPILTQRAAPATNLGKQLERVVLPGQAIAEIERRMPVATKTAA